MSNTDMMRQMAEQIVALRQAVADLQRQERPRGRLRARLGLSSNQNVTTATTTVVQVDTVGFDRGGFYNVSTPYRLTAPIAGAYIIAGQVNIGANATGYRQAALRLNGTTTVAFTRVPAVTDTGANTLINAATIIECAAGDYVELLVAQTSGATLALATTNCFLAMARVV